MKYLFIIFTLFLIIKNDKAFSYVLPNDIFSPSEVIELQMSALQTNSISNNAGIYQCWLFAHPENKKYTGPFSNFKKMIANTSYRILLNSVKFKTNLLSKVNDVVKFSVEVDGSDNKRYNLIWILEKAKINDKCLNCWMTTSVTQPQYIGQLN
ncbi:hypothetical protein OAT44_01460 [Alphaproteobacteria bacterium]|nr:hypothetical protein [Alphaproteobacteria bacterium]